MKIRNPFKPTGFDTYIAKGTSLDGSMAITGTVVVDGTFVGKIIHGGPDTTLVIGGSATKIERIDVDNLTVTGTVECDTLVVSNQLAVKNGGVIRAKTISYKMLVVQPSAIISGQLIPLGQAEPAADLIQ